MSDAVKWTLLVTGLVAIVAGLVVGLQDLNVSSVAEGLSDAIDTTLPYVEDSIKAAKGFFNNLAGSAIPLNTILFSLLVYPFIKFGSKLVLAAYHWILK